MQAPILLLVIAASLTLCFNLWPSIRHALLGEEQKIESSRPRLLDKIYIYLPSAASTIGMFLISFMHGGMIPFLLGLAGYFLLAALIFVEYIRV